MGYTEHLAAVAADSPAASWSHLETSGTTAADATGNGRTATFAGSPLLNQTSTIPGYDGPVVLMDGTNDHITVADHVSLEATGAGFTVRRWLKMDAAGTGDVLYVIADKTGLSKTNAQWTVFWDNRVSQGSPLALKAQWGNATVVPVLTWSGTVARDALLAGGMLTVVFQGNSIGFVYWNDELVASAALTNYPASAGNAANTRALEMGYNSTPAFRFKGEFGPAAVWGGALAAHRIRAHYAEAVGDAPVSVTRTIATAKVHESSTYDAFPGVVKCPNGDLLTVFTRNTAHLNSTSAYGLYSTRSTDDGATWSSPVRIVANDATNAYMSSSLSVVGSDVALVTWRKPLTGGSPLTDGIRIFLSTDSGATWGSEVIVDTGSTHPQWAVSESPLLLHTDGYYYLGAWGQDSATTNDTSSSIIRSTDLTTWTTVATFDTGGLNGYNECAVVAIGSTLVALMRREDDGATYTSTSTDGTTWSSPVVGRSFAASAPRTSTVGPGGRAYAILRYGITATNLVTGAYLADVDATGAIREVEPLGQGQRFMYGQVAVLDDETIVGVWAAEDVAVPATDADVFSAKWTLTGFTLDVDDAPATATAAATVESLTIPLAIDDDPATATAVAVVEGALVGLGVDDGAATATASAALESVVVPYRTDDTPASATASAAVEFVNIGGGLDVADLPANATASATSETVDMAGEPLSTTFDVVELEDMLWVELTAASDLDVAVPILSEKHPSPVLTEALPAHQPWVDYTPTTSVVGFAHVWVDGVDITYHRGSPILVRNWTKEAPWGDKTAMWEMPQLDPWDVVGEGDLSFIRKGARVVIGLVDDVTGEITRKWSGFYHARRKGFDSAEDYVFEAHGTMWAAMFQAIEPVPYQPPVDIGVLIPRLLNKLVGRPFNAIPETPFGLPTRYRGARDEKVWQAVQNILARDGWTADGRQVTLVQESEDEFRLALKAPMSEIHGTVAWGNPGVDFDISIDEDSRVDGVFCRWVAPGGGASANVFYPGVELLSGLPYPNADAGDFINLGDTDSGTTSLTGVTDFQEKARELKFSRLAVTGVQTSAWVEVVREIQRALSITVDGSIGPQTWETVFTVIDESIDLTPRRLPMAVKPEAWPWIDGANGVILGENPAFDGLPPNYVYLDMGTNITRPEVRRHARTYLEVHGQAVAVGTASFRGCIDDLARTDIDVGQNILVRGFEGEDVALQVGRLSVDLDASAGAYVVSVSADERARDALTIDQILDRNREALPDPARRPGTPTRSSRNVRDEGFTWDDDAPCGVLTKTAMNGEVGLWTPKVIPFSERGQLAGIDLTSTVPFAFALFESLRITPNILRGLMPGGPFASSDPWRPIMDTLVDEYGLLACWGAQDDACGYGFGMESDGFAFNGRFREGNTLEFRTEDGVNVKALFFARGNSGFVSGEFLHAVQT